MLKRIFTLFLLPALLLAQAPKVSVTTRQATGAPLTFTQADKNFTDLQAAANASLRAWGQKESATTGLTYGYYGGPAFNGTTWVTAADGTVTMVAGAVNFIERNSVGIVTSNTLGWTTGKTPLAKVSTSGSIISSVVDYRSDLVSVGQAITAAALGRPPRILLVGESILNSTLITGRIQAAIPGAQIERRTYGGSMAVWGLSQLAPDAKGYTTTGNLLGKSDPTTWPGPTNCAVSATKMPTTRKPGWLITATGAGTARINGNGASNGGLTVPSGAPPLTYSLEFEPGTLTSCQLSIYNATKGGVVRGEGFTQQYNTDRNGLPSRMVMTITSADGITYSAGDILYAYIYVGTLAEIGVSGTIYVTDILVNQGPAASAFRATTGTPETPSASGWLASQSVGLDIYDLVVIQFGRNDSNSDIGVQYFEQVLSGCIAGASYLAPRVLVCPCPPAANVGLTAWDASDNMTTKGYLAAIQRAARRSGAYYYDADSDFKLKVSSGIYSVSQLMRDVYHPTDADSTSAGMGLYVSQIVGVLAGDDRGVRQVGPVPVFRYFGQTSGSWTLSRFSMGVSPTYCAEGPVAGYRGPGITVAHASSTIGDSITYALPAGRCVGLIGVADSATAGTVTVAIDGAQPVTINLQSAGLTNYPQGFFVQGGLPNEPHTVVVKVASGQARVIGVVGI